MNRETPRRAFLRETLTDRTDFRVLRSESGDTIVRQNCPDGQFWLIGRGTWSFSGDARSQTVTTMDVAYSAPGQPCRRVAMEDIVAFGIQIRGNWLARWEETQRWLVPGTPIPWDFRRAYLALMRSFVTGALCGNELEDEIVRLLSKTAPSPDLGRGSRRLKLARDMIRSDEPAADALATLADAVGMAPAYLSASYRAAYGVTPSVERRRNRLAKAFRIADRLERSLNQAAIEAGFYDASHFHRACLAELGMRPADVVALLRPHEIETLYKT